MANIAFALWIVSCLHDDYCNGLVLRVNTLSTVAAYHRRIAAAPHYMKWHYMRRVCPVLVPVPQSVLVPVPFGAILNHG